MCPQKDAARTVDRPRPRKGLDEGRTGGQLRANCRGPTLGRQVATALDQALNAVRFDEIDRPDFSNVLSHTIEMRKKLTSRFVETVAPPTRRRADTTTSFSPVCASAFSQPVGNPGPWWGG